MAGNTTEEYDAGGSSSSTEGLSAGPHCQSIDSLAEWRSSEQVENGTPSTSPPFWDTDDDDDDDDECGPKPSELYGKFTWKVENFRQINKRELKSNTFEIGGYKWYILIYPQGCDVCNYLSLFLCVANHDKLHPGWSHFAQFTIAVVNKDPKKSKFSDTLHRFWKKEHDWGWKKFMENSKVHESFVNDDTLVIKAQVQVIREKANRLFRCLDYQYRRELVRVYLSNAEQICQRFIEDRKNKLSKLIDDKIRWQSFCSFWTGIDKTSRQRMSRDKSDTILRVVFKQFFVEKEVTSTLVMDSLHSGLKALEHQSKNMKGRSNIEIKESTDPMVRVEKGMFVLGDDVVLLLNRVASDPLPTTSIPPKDDKASLNRAKEGSSGEEFNKESLKCDERRLTALGQRIVEICAVAHIFSSRIEVAYQEDVALKRQEELIREEEASGQVKHEIKAKRATADKEKRAKKKQAKQKWNNRRSKDQQRVRKSDLVLKDCQSEILVDEIVSAKLSSNQKQFTCEKVDTPDDASDVSYTGEEVVETLHPDLNDRDNSLVNWNSNALEAHPCMETRTSYNLNEQTEKTSTFIDDSSSTCSTDSVPSIVPNGPYKEFSSANNRSQTSSNRVKNQLSKDLLSQEFIAGHFDDSLRSNSSCRDMDADATHLRDSKHWPEKHVNDKLEEVATLQKKILVKDQGDAKRSSASSSTLEVSSASEHSGRKTRPLVLQPKKSLESSTASLSTITASVADPVLIKLPPAANTALNGSVPKNTTAQPSNAISKPSSCRLGIDSSPAPSCVPQSYRNAIFGKPSTGLSHKSSNQFATAYTSTSLLPPQSGARKEHQINFRPNFTFGSVKLDALPNNQEWREDGLHQASTCSNLTNGIKRLEICTEQLRCSQPNGGMVDDFPHLDIINDLLNDEQCILGSAASGSNLSYSQHHLYPLFSHQYSFPSDQASSSDHSLMYNTLERYDHVEQYYNDSFQSMYPQLDLSASCAIGQMHDMVQIQWPSYGHAVLGTYGYSYQFPDHTDLGRGANEYGMHPP